MVDQVVKGRCLSSQAALPPSGLSRQEASQAKPAAANAADFNEVWSDVWRNQPAAPTRDKPVEVCVVGGRCVYVNNYRVAGGKPYVSESLPSHTLKTTLGEVLDAFTPTEIRKALSEQKARKDYLEAYHARKAAAEATASVDTLPKGGDGEAGSVRSKGSAVPAEERADAHPGAGQ